MKTTRRNFLIGASAGLCALQGHGADRGSRKPPFSLTVLNPDCMSGGAGQCCILRMPSGKTYLYDTGNGDFRGKKTKNNGRDLVAPWLLAHGVTRIDGLLISHYHADHFGGFLWLKDHFEIGKIFNNNYTPELETEKIENVAEYAVPRRALDEWGAANPGALVENTRAGDDLGWSEAGVKVEVVWPPREGYVKPIANREEYLKKDSCFHHLLNGNSTALRIVADGKVFFIIGDIQADYLATYMRPYLKSRGLWGADFVVLPAHGTKPNEEAAILADMSPAPRAVVASLGNLPWMIESGREAVQVFSGKDIAAYATNLYGDVTAQVANGKLVIANDVDALYGYDPK